MAKWILYGNERKVYGTICIIDFLVLRTGEDFCLSGKVRRAEGMGRGRKILAAIFIFIFSMSIGSVAFATNAEVTDGELTEEEILQQELNKAYSIAVESNGIKGWPQGPGTYGEAAIVMEVGTGAILYGKNIDSHQFPASITKVLTALVALENGQLTDQVVFSHDCVAFMQPGDSSIGMKEGNVITLEQALYAMLLASANEAAYAVGENVGKNAGYDYQWFIGQMNNRCKELGGGNSNFVNTNGLHDAEHYTCARDMALIGRELFKHPEFFTIVQTLEYKIEATSTTEEHIFQQKHKMLRPENQNYYAYAVGGKTGFTSDARSTLITMADNGTTQLVCVVLRTYGKNVYPDTRNLFEYAFQNFTKVPVSDQETSEDIAEILPEENGGYVMLPAGVEFSSLDMEITRDETNPQEAVLTYSYEGNLVGTARARLSESYLKEKAAKVQKVEKKEKKKKDTGKNMEEIRDRIILAGAVVLLVVLVAAFLRLVIRQRRRRKMRRKRD